jgi:flagellin-specific chaperone FliS
MSQPTSPLSPSSLNNQTINLVNEVIIEPGIEITNVQQMIPNTSITTETTFNTTDPDKYVPVIKEELKETIEYNFDDNVITESDNIVLEIKDYANKIKCDDFHGKGTIEDYTELFKAASKIANESKQMELNIEVDGFDEFGRAADELSELFTNFTKKLQNINIINDVKFLNAVLNALKKIYNLSEVFGRFKKTILVTSEIKVPKTAHDAKNIVKDVMDEVNCAMNYIGHFVAPNPNLSNANLSNDDKNIINKAVTTIDNWKTLCDQGLSIALDNNADMLYLKNVNQDLKMKTSLIKNVASNLRQKLAQMNN